MAKDKQDAPKKRGVGRPRKEINEEQLAQLAGLGCTLAEMASFFDCDVKTLTSNYSQVIKKGKDMGNISLRRDQRRLAKNSASMAIFLGKNTLDQRDRQELQHTGKDGGPLQVTVTVVNKPKESAE